MSRELLAHLTDGCSSLVVAGDGGMPEVVHWGAALGEGTLDMAAFDRAVVGGGLDVDPPAGLVTESSRGWFGKPGIEGSRTDGGDFAPRFALVSHEASDKTARFSVVDDNAGLTIELTIELHQSGVYSFDASLNNSGDSPYTLNALRLTVPVGIQAGEVLTLVGRHLFEFSQQRTPWDRSTITVENRHGKTSHERLGMVAAGTPHFGEHSGEVWLCHLAWSGNYELACDAVTDGRRIVQAGELLLPGEIELAAGQSYAAPTLLCAYSDSGLNPASSQFHEHLRSRRPPIRLPRPVHLNVWEAVYFDHDLDKLRRLADLAARVGVERFVLDDGWFGSRRDDTSGLGDWWVSAQAWPDGLSPIIEHVTSLGMEFGIWFEPEMVNPDSDLYRAHPDWVLADPRYPHVLGRHQLVLDVGRPEVRDYLFEHIDAVLRDNDIAYVKWDHNRDLVSPTSDRRAGVHRQTVGAYELFDRLRTAHPNVEFESCASGGGRVDFGILAHAERIWTSDSIDALDRHSIQRGFSILFPPEIMGSHIGAEKAHTTKRVHRLGFRGAVALFGAFGIEWNLLEATDADLDQLAELVALHKKLRPLLHTGTVVRTDHPDSTVEVHGVVSKTLDEAVFAVSRLASAPTHHIAPLRLPGLDPNRTYEIRIVDELGERLGGARQQPSWVSGKLVMTGRQIASAGFACPELFPDSTMLLQVRSAERT